MKYCLIAIIFLFTTSLYAQEGKIAPGFRLENLDGEIITLEENLGGGPILISFWATWCKPCIEELPEIEKIYDELKEKGLKAFAISVDGEKSVAKVEPFVKAKKLSVPVLLDTNSDIARIYYATTVPFTVIIASKGEIVYSHSGYKKGDEIQLKAKLVEILGAVL
ncbi:MAG: TlpA family protein disulfide reductase [Ignavibacteriales bacterium]|nr:TlpA family protein disulfide reductase [Ignavibacteriales bacterium]